VANSFLLAGLAFLAYMAALTYSDGRRFSELTRFEIQS
jgi:hypothetical protein